MKWILGLPETECMAVVQWKYKGKGDWNLSQPVVATISKSATTKVITPIRVGAFTPCHSEYDYRHIVLPEDG